jgi:predicted dithiol-disulfide oxidoreductase (DUF899 family)
MSELNSHPVVSRDEWREARKRHLADEKELTRLRDRLSAQRRALPWVRVEKDYVFAGSNGPVTLAEAFDGRRQLIVQHFMYGPDWEEGCKSCSFWMDNLNGTFVHLADRDATFVAISRAPYPTLAAYRDRMGWDVTWLSSLDSDFNFDFNVSFEPGDGPKEYNYAEQPIGMDELPGFSIFYKDSEGEIFHTYSCYARGLDMLNSAYHCLDLLPKGRDEEAGMSWVRHHDKY